MSLDVQMYKAPSYMEPSLAKSLNVKRLSDKTG